MQARGGGSAQTYDLLVGAVGVNSPALKVFQRLGFDYRQPGSFITSQTTTQFKAKGP